MSDERSDGGDVLDPPVEDPHADGISRRRLLRSSAAAGAAGAATTAGCLGSPEPDMGGTERTTTGDEAGRAGTVFVFNTGDKTVSAIDAATDEVLTTSYLGATASFPSNQYVPRLVNATRGALWLNVDDGVVGVDPRTLETVATVETGTGKNWLELSPDGSRLVVSAREPAHKQFRIDADRESDRFGEVTGTIDRTADYGGRKGGPAPCDVSFAPDGRYAFVPDLFGNTLTVIDVDAFEIATQVDVDPVLSGAKNASPWMGTASWDGRYLAVEHNEGNDGSESLWDVSDPARPEELTRLTTADGLGRSPLTDEIGPESETAYVFTPGTRDVSVVDLSDRTVTKRIDLGGQAFVGTWNPARTKLYVPVQTADEVAVIDHASQSVTRTIPVGSKPYGATAGRVRPVGGTTEQMLAVLASIGVTMSGERTTHCLGNCYCGSHD